MAKGLFQSPKGVRDILPEDQVYWRRVEDAIRKIVDLYGYERLDLPVFEDTGLFRRGVGEATDIVEKEMYTFKDKGDKSITLRPEFTAGVMRSFIQNSMDQLPKPTKLYNIGQVFRYERPQAGRFRQFYQFNVEALGEVDPALDFEIMSMAYHLYDELGFENLSFQINSIGCPHCRPGFHEQLTSYYKQRFNDICTDCQTRLDKNPLRLLDCKREQCQPIIEVAPSMADCLCDECRDHFKTLRRYLDDAGRLYTVNHRMVRGLDYYTKTVFEVWAQGIGAQNAVCGGGRYDGLSEILGGKPMPGIGFAAGIDRIVMSLQAQDHLKLSRPAPQAFFVTQGAGAKEQAVRLIIELRNAGISAMLAFGDRSFKAQFKEADKRRTRFTIVIGEGELEGQYVTVKNMSESSQENVPWSELVEYIGK
ncbi:histidine--tRNA ligase [bacterium]|nr:histidine--tRNA ligase [bacterium]